jgi:hypothetical protein
MQSPKKEKTLAYLSHVFLSAGIGAVVVVFFWRFSCERVIFFLDMACGCAESGKVHH